MKTKANKNTNLVKESNSVSPSLVEARLKGKVLFAEKIETITEFLNKVKVSAL